MVLERPNRNRILGEPSMSRWPNLFFAAATFYILIGVSLGLYMAVNHDFTLAPAHAHLNLVGWASLAIMGAFYALLGRETPRRLIAANFVLSNIGVLCMVSALALILADVVPAKAVGPVFGLGALCVIGGFVCFAVAVGRSFAAPRQRLA